MSYGLNSNKDLFVFNMPTDFIPDELEERYKILIKNYHLPFMTIVDYINSTILDINLPSISQTPVVQSKMYGKQRSFRSGISPYDLYNKEISINMQDIDHGIPATIVHDAWLHHYIKNGKPFVEPFVVTRLDEERRELFKYVFSEIIPISFSDIRLGYQEKDDSSQTNTLTCKFNKVDIEFIPRYESDGDSGKLIENYFDRLIINDPNNNIDQNGNIIDGSRRSDNDDTGFIGK